MHYFYCNAYAPIMLDFMFLWGKNDNNDLVNRQENWNSDKFLQFLKHFLCFFNGFGTKLEQYNGLFG